MSSLVRQNNKLKHKKEKTQSSDKFPNIYFIACVRHIAHLTPII
jgi:hypothetical protein